MLGGPRAHLFYSFITVYCLLVFVSPARGQITNDTTSQATPTPGDGHDYMKMLNETVNPSDGSISLNISLKTPRGRGLTLPFAYTYSSNAPFLQPTSVVGQEAWGYDRFNTQLSQGSWSTTLPWLSVVRIEYMPSQLGQTPCYAATNYVFHDPSGGSHSLGLADMLSDSGVLSCQTVGWTAQTTGGDDFFKATLLPAIGGASPPNPAAGEVFVADADGTVYNFNATSPWGVLSNGDPANTTAEGVPATIEDRNGNIVTLGGGPAPTSIVDSTGRTEVSFSGGLFGTTTVAGLSGSYTLTMGTATASGVSVNAQPQLPDTNCFNGVPAFKGGGPAATVLKLPNGQQYTFTYDPAYGLLSKITYPTGGYISYVWGLNSQSAIVSYPDTTGYANGCVFKYDRPAVFKRFVSFDGSTNALEQDFSYSTTWSVFSWTNKTTTVTTKDLIAGTSSTTAYSYSPTVAPAAPNTSEPQINNSIPQQIPIETSITFKDAGGTVLKTINKGWNATVQFPNGDPYELGGESQTLDNGVSSTVEYTWGPGHTITDKKEWDFGVSTSGTPTRETKTAYQSFAATPIYSYAPSILNRPSSVSTYGAGTLLAQTVYGYDQSSLTAVSPLTGHDDTNYPATYTNRGNITTKTLKCFIGSASCTDAVTKNTYDQAGQTRTTIDPNGNVSGGTPSAHTTTYSYTDNYASGTGTPPTGKITDAYVTTITYPVTGSTSHVENFTYGYSDGQLRTSKDQNSQTTTYKYIDSLARLTEVDYPDTGQTNYAYTDTPGSVHVEKASKIDATRFTHEFTYFDGLGHPINHSTANDETTPYDKVDTCYNGLGLVQFRSSPYQASSYTASQVCSGTGDAFSYDALGRVLSVTHADGNISTTSYTGAATKITDEGNGTASTQRISQMDALGHLIAVCEISGSMTVGGGATAASCGLSISGTGFLTSYQYDALGNLTQVTQNALNPRTFTYDSLSRLLTARNPESGLTCYGTETTPGTCDNNGYDANGNLLYRTRPAPNQNGTTTSLTEYTYDALNRVTHSGHSYGTSADSDYQYDQTSISGVSPHNPIGRMTRHASDNGYASTIISYDPMGRIIGEWQATRQNAGTGSFPLTFGYDLIGDLASETNGEGKTFTYGYNVAGRVIQATSSYVDSAHPATLLAGVHYNAFAMETSATLGDTVSGHASFSETRTVISTGNGKGRGWLGSISATTSPAYSVSLTYDPNGDVKTANDSVNGNYTYTYDLMNRLTEASSSAHDCTETYDRFGNRYAQAVHGGTCTTWSQSFDANNHINTGGYTYDAAGNVTYDLVHHYTYDAENRLLTVDTTGVVFEYDAVGNRVRKATPSTAWEYVYDLSGHAFTEVTSAGVWSRGEVYAGSRHLATYSGGTTTYPIADWLGTEHFHASVTGGSAETCTSLPFGDLQTCTGTIWTPDYFTGKERDVESGLDNFEARYYSSTMGRFMTPDWDAKPTTVPYAKYGDPQTLNLYSYVENSPLNRVDADGHWWYTGAGGSSDSDLCFGYTTELCIAGASAKLTNAESSAHSEATTEAAAQQGAQNQGQPAPTNPDGSPKSPNGDVPKPPPGKPPGWKPGDPLAPNEWVPKDPGKGDREKWGPKYPIPGESQPGVSWDPEGHWDHDDGNRNRTRWLPGGGGQVDHDNNPTIMDRMRSITPGPILKWGTAGVVIYIIIDEGSRLYPPRNLVPVP